MSTEYPQRPGPGGSEAPLEGRDAHARCEVGTVAEDAPSLLRISARHRHGPGPEGHEGTKEGHRTLVDELGGLCHETCGCLGVTRCEPDEGEAHP